MTVSTILPVGPDRIVVRADWPYEAWDAAHAAMRRNLTLTERFGSSFLFEITGEPRWPVAADHYRKMARNWHERVSHLRLVRADPAAIRQAMELARVARVRLFDAKAGCVTDSATMQSWTGA